MVDLIVAGGGPAGLATAIAAAQAQLSVVVLERRPLPADKACGEGILPGGVALLEQLGVRLDPDECAPIRGISYLQEDGGGIETRLPAPGGLGVRRTVLSSALLARARSLGVEVQDRCELLSYRAMSHEVRVECVGSSLGGRLLVAADGLHSPLRRAAGLARPCRSRKRYGVRRHFGRAPWSTKVEVHFARGVEAYVTPVSPRCVGVALLYEKGRADGEPGFDRLLSRFPLLLERLGSAPPLSDVRGGGPLAQSCRARVADRLVLVGDAAGYVDAITGEGLSLALACAVGLSRVLPTALAQGATAAALAPYERLCRRAFLRYAVPARLLVELAAHPAARTRALRLLGRYPWLFQRIVDWTIAM